MIWFFSIVQDKLLNKLEGSEPEQPTSQEDECVICINARATMQTSPCGHRVVCRRCFVKTIQSAVAQRMLPLRCVICRARINRLISSSGTWRIQESASNYSVGTTKSWTVRIRFYNDCFCDSVCLLLPIRSIASSDYRLDVNRNYLAFK